MSKYLEILFRHRLRFITLLFILPALAGAGVVAAFPHNTGEASLWTEAPTYFGLAANPTGWNQYLTPAQNTVDALTQLTYTNAFLKSLSSDLDKSGAGLTVDERASVFTNYSTDMKITASGSHLVLLNYTCSRRAICVDVLASTIQIYQDWLVVQEQAQAKVALDFYTGQLSEAKTKLQQDQKALQDYLALNPGVKPADAVVNSDYNQLLRAVTDDQANVNALQQKLDSLNLTEAATQQIDATVLKVIDPPRITGGQLSSLPRKQLAIAEAAVLALAAAVLVVMAWSDRTVRDPKELQSRLHIPVVATIPDLATGAPAHA